MSFDTRDVGYFLGVARLGHVGRAAEALGLSQPAVSKGLARLERELGLPLFERTSRGMRLTAAGEAFVPRAERIQADYDDAMRMAGDLRAGSVGLLRIGASTAAAEAWVTPALAALRRRRPSMRFSLSVRLSSEVIAALRAGLLDVAVAPASEPAEDDLARTPLGTDDVVVVAAQRHALFRGPAPTLERLARCGWILPREPLASRRWIVETFERAGVAPPVPVVEVDYGSADAIALAARTDLLTFAPLPRPRRAWPVPIRQVELPGLTLRRRFAALTRRGAHRSALLETFVEAMVQAG